MGGRNETPNNVSGPFFCFIEILRKESLKSSYDITNTNRYKGVDQVKYFGVDKAPHPHQWRTLGWLTET